MHAALLHKEFLQKTYPFFGLHFDYEVPRTITNLEKMAKNGAKKRRREWCQFFHSQEILQSAGSSCLNVFPVITYTLFFILYSFLILLPQSWVCCGSWKFMCRSGNSNPFFPLPDHVDDPQQWIFNWIMQDILICYWLVAESNYIIYIKVFNLWKAVKSTMECTENKMSSIEPVTWPKYWHVLHLKKE